MAELLASVVVPAFNSETTLRDTLQSLEAQTVRDRLHVLVVDNGSTDSSVEIAREYADRVIIERAGAGGAARTAGLHAITTDLMLTIDSDCVPVSDDWAATHIRAMADRDDMLLAAAGRTLPHPTEERWSAREDITPHPSFADGRPLYAVGGNACFAAKALVGLGGFPDVGADDALLGVRARKAGYSFKWVPEAAVYHRNPVGRLGYFRQMRKIGRYGVEVNGAPESRTRFYVERLRYLPRVAQLGLGGEWHEASATVLAVAGQMLGAREAWRQVAAPTSHGRDRTGVVR